MQLASKPQAATRADSPRRIATGSHWRDETMRISVTACVLLATLALATLADALRPAGKIKQIWIITEGKAALGLAAATVRQPDQAEAAGALITETQLPMGFR